MTPIHSLRPMARLPVPLLALCFFFMAVRAHGMETPTTIHLLSYHNHPPFVTGPEQGLTFDVAKSLTELAAGKWKFQVRIVPRSRLDLELKPWIQGQCTPPTSAPCGDDWSVLWVNPSWGFGGPSENGFHWLKMFEDSNAIISLKESPVDYQTPESLRGLRFGGIRGHQYVGIDDLVTAGGIQRIDGNHERDNIMMLLLKRLDVLLLPTSTIHYFLTKDDAVRESAPKIHVAPVRHQYFWRHFLIPATRKDLEDLFQRWLDKGNFQSIDK
ncbi:MAG: hypothetical protein HQL74_01615 [Magnetococcales bacterium]|nr:hypothetical protein [Magnetococcales bacterium]